MLFTLLSTVVLIAIGLVCGAALNAVADDLPRRARPRLPHCLNCDHAFGPWQWIALVAFAARRRCARCGAPLAWRRPVVELVSAALWPYVFARFGLTLQFALLSILLECLLLITVIDLEHRLILHVTIVPTGAVAALYSLAGAERGLAKTLIGGAVGFVAIYLVYRFGWAFGALMARVRGQSLSEVPFGEGDVNLSGVVGLAVGWTGIVLALVVAILAGGVGALIYLAVMIARRRASVFMVIPYGPFLVAGAVMMLLFDSQIKYWLVGR